MNELAIVGQVTDQRMLAHEVELLLLVGVTLEQSPQGAQVIAARGGGYFTGPFDGRARMAPGQAEQALQHAHPFNAAYGNDRLGPARAVRAQTAYLAQSQAAPRSTLLIFSAAICCPWVLKRPGSCLTCRAICSKRWLKIRTTRASQRAHTLRVTYSGGTE